MAKTITTPINVVNNISNLTKWSVLDYNDQQSLVVPCVSVLVQMYHGSTIYMYPIWLTAFDVQNSLCLLVNPSSQNQADQLMVGYRGLPGAYTAITTAHDNTTGNNKTKLLAVETSIQTVGLIDAAFTGT